MGLFSPPQTPEARGHKSPVIAPSRLHTPPPSSHRAEITESPKTPTHASLNNDGGTSLFDDNGRIQPPPTPVLYNLIRNDGAQKFVAAAPPRHKDFLDGIPLHNSTEEGDDSDTDTLRGHPSACLFVARQTPLDLN